MIKSPKNPEIINNNENLTSKEILDKQFEKKSSKSSKTKSFADKKRLEKQVIKEIKEKEKPVKEIKEEIQKPQIEFIIKKTSYFHPNWFYIKTVFINCKNFIFHPIKFFKKQSAHKIHLENNKIVDTQFLQSDETLPRDTDVLLFDDNEKLYEEIIKPHFSIETLEIKKMDDKVLDKPHFPEGKRAINKMFEIVRSDK